LKKIQQLKAFWEGIGFGERHICLNTGDFSRRMGFFLFKNQGIFLDG